jgi:hypothetical protein
MKRILSPFIFTFRKKCKEFGFAPTVWLSSKESSGPAKKIKCKTSRLIGYFENHWRETGIFFLCGRFLDSIKYFHIQLSPPPSFWPAEFLRFCLFPTTILRGRCALFGTAMCITSKKSVNEPQTWPLKASCCRQAKHETLSNRPYELTMPVPWLSTNNNTKGKAALEVTGACRCYADLRLYFGCSKCGYHPASKSTGFGHSKFSTHFSQNWLRRAKLDFKVMSKYLDHFCKTANDVKINEYTATMVMPWKQYICLFSIEGNTYFKSVCSL